MIGIIRIMIITKYMHVYTLKTIGYNTSIQYNDDINDNIINDIK